YWRSSSNNVSVKHFQISAIWRDLHYKSHPLPEKSPDILPGLRIKDRPPLPDPPEFLHIYLPDDHIMAKDLPHSPDLRTKHENKEHHPTDPQFGQKRKIS